MVPCVIVVMGVAGSGKTTVARRLARRLGWPFLEGDALHPRANVEKMRSGVALTDADRAPWLDAIAAWIAETRAAGLHRVVACSALRRAYRERLAHGREDVVFVYLRGERALLDRRLGAREGHFMPASLLASQLAALEPPGPGENAIMVAIEGPPEGVVDDIVFQLQLPTGGDSA